MLFRIMILTTYVKVKIIGSEIQSFSFLHYIIFIYIVALNDLIGENPFKNIYLIRFRAFVSKFMAFEYGSFLKIYPKNLQKRMY